MAKKQKFHIQVDVTNMITSKAETYLKDVAKAFKKSQKKNTAFVTTDNVTVSVYNY